MSETPRFHIKTEEKFAPVDTIEECTQAAIGSFLAGSVFAVARNSMSKTLVGPFGILGKAGLPILTFTVGGTSFVFGKSVASNLREKNDALNDFYGGALAGSLLGAFTRSVSKCVGTGVLAGALLGVASWGGYSLNGLGKDSSFYSINKADPFGETLKSEKQGFWEMVYRRPMSETVKDLGEGNVVFKP